jgi:hypothetical protein
MKNLVSVGLSQRLQLDWLERTASLQHSGASPAEIRNELDLLLKDKLSVGTTSTKQTNRRKAINNLMKIWVSVPLSLEPLRDEGLEHLQALPVDKHLPLHWGMTMAVYPFFQVIAETVGRLLNLQDTIAAAQVYRRVQEQLGERSTVSRASRRILRSFIDWQVLEDTKEKGVYQATQPQPIEDGKLALWLIEAALIAADASSSPLKIIAQSPALFPFNVEPTTVGSIVTESRLEISRQGLDDKVVVLK